MDREEKPNCPTCNKSQDFRSYPSGNNDGRYVNEWFCMNLECVESPAYLRLLALGRDPANFGIDPEMRKRVTEELGPEIEGLIYADTLRMAANCPAPSFTDHILDLLNRNYPLPRNKKVGRA